MCGKGEGGVSFECRSIISHTARGSSSHQVRRDFVLQCIKLNPKERATVGELLKHEFFKPVVDDSVKRVNKAMTTINVSKISDDGTDPPLH